MPKLEFHPILFCNACFLKTSDLVFHVFQIADSRSSWEMLHQAMPARIDGLPNLITIDLISFFTDC